MLNFIAKPDEDASRVRLLFLGYADLLGLLSMDGMRAYRVLGLPPDARILSAADDDQCLGVVLRVWSASFPPIRPGDFIGYDDIRLDVSYIDLAAIGPAR